MKTMLIITILLQGCAWQAAENHRPVIADRGIPVVKCDDRRSQANGTCRPIARMPR